MLNSSIAPWVVGREALLEYAIDDYLRELGRARPWLGKTHEEVLTHLNAHLDAKHGLTPLRVLHSEEVNLWVQAQDPEAQQVMQDFKAYVTEWNWLD